MVVLPPGTLLQLWYLEERLRGLPPGRFIEIGPGSGELTHLLLRLGWRGTSYDLEMATVEALRERFSDAVAKGLFEARNEDFVTAKLGAEQADLVISCMVMEHMDDDQEQAYMEQAAHCLASGGLMIGLVPASPKHWGIEDDIAGHMRRYTRTSINELMAKNRWRINHCKGLTYPLSNLLLPLSNHLVQRAEKNRLELSNQERTKLSGRRKVIFKTHFPALTGLLLNRVTLWPFHMLQKWFSGSSHALVLYFEAQPIHDINT